MKIWIDLATAPQVHFFRPIIGELEKRGVGTLITTRRFTETVPLADRSGFPHTVLGAHGGKSLLRKGVMIALRSIQLAKHIRGDEIRLAISHGSYSQALCAKMTGIPFITFQDYEGHPGNHILCRVAKKIYVPTMFDQTELRRYGASDTLIETYMDLKERVYLSDFVPDSTILKRLDIRQNEILVTVRPPSSVSTYHRFENPLFDELLSFLSSQENLKVVLISRGQTQKEIYQSKNLPNVIIPEGVIDGPNLIFHSDLVAGAGGTMNREAVVLGTPVYTLFGGKMGSVDRNLINKGWMRRIQSIEDIWGIELNKKPAIFQESLVEGESVVRKLVDRILEISWESDGNRRESVANGRLPG